MLSALPVEVLLEIIQRLPFRTVVSLSALSKSWATFMGTNESSIYHSISKRYRCSPEGDFDTPPPEGWRAWLIHKLRIELRWIGELPGNPHAVRISGGAWEVQGIEVDEEAGYVINTFTNGGLVVSDINDYRILWALDEEICGPYNYCGHDEGYIVLGHPGNLREIWRRRTDVLDIPEEAWPSEPHNKPASHMIQANLVAEDQYFDASRSRDPDHLRGQFVPWAHLEIPDGGWTFKLARGTLLVSDANSASLYAVEKAELQQSIDIGGHHWGRFRYADASEQHIFIVSTFQLNVYDRADGSRVLMIPAGRLPWDYYATPENQWRYTEETFNHGEPNFRRDVSPNPVDREDYFYTVRVSSCGKHLAMALSNRIVLVQDFWRLLTPDPVKLQQISKQINLHLDFPMFGCEGWLTYDRGKVAAVGIDGVFVIVLDPIFDRLGEVDPVPKDVSLQNLQPTSLEHEPPWPNLRLHKVQFGDPPVNMDKILRLKSTETKIYLSVLPGDILDGEGGNMWCYDFASSS